MRPHRRRFLSALRYWSVLIALIVAACGGSSQNLTQCGNGRIDSGEQCDDGNTIDTDACTSVCHNARCGDGAIEAGVETCDGTNIGFATCTGLGYSPGRLNFPGCLASCDGFDVSVCGAQFTSTPVVPTATQTATPTSTPTASPTPTLPVGSCGNGLLQPGETCESCPADCQVAACTPSGATFTFAVALASSRAPTDAEVELAYRSSVISIPGSGSDVTVRQRVRFAPPPPTTFMVDDLNYAVDITSARALGLPTAASLFATAKFDGCSGAFPPTVDDLSCIIVRCADASGAIPGCSCVVTAQP
ncbi:MAG TPA: hypothetical protein VL049_17995 [Candidatus Dormibacteraeota bacterium]|nr:hypothetical protein [Candidatus Dormibacteraeota bacterium]